MLAAFQLWSLRKMGAVWPRAIAPTGRISARARKLSEWMSFIVAIAILRSTFLLTNLYAQNYNFSIRAASISRVWRDCQAGAAQTFGGCFGQSATVPHGFRTFGIPRP